MPELPEVQIQVNQLARRLAGRRILRVICRDPKIQLPRSLAGQRILTIRRRAKHIVVQLSGGRYLLAHLRMTGWFEFREPATWRVAIITRGGTAYLADLRRFATLQVVTAARLRELFARLGPEPLEASFDPIVLRQTHRAIKIALLDQQLVAGVGNIYASEALFRARLSPRRRASRLTLAECRRLHRGLVAAMRQAIGYGPRIFAVQQFRVYDRAGRACHRCRSPVRRIVQAQRSTFYCPRCQR